MTPSLPRIDRASPVRLVPITHLRALHRLMVAVITIQLINLALNLLRLYR